MTELLRAREDIDYSGYIDEMDKALNKFCDILSEA